MSWNSDCRLTQTSCKNTRVSHGTVYTHSHFKLASVRLEEEWRNATEFELIWPHYTLVCITSLVKTESECLISICFVWSLCLSFYIQCLTDILKHTSKGFWNKKMKLHLMRCLEWQNTSVMRYEASLRGNCVVMVMSWLAQLTLFLLSGVSRRTTAGTQMDLRHPGASRLSQRCGRHCVCKLNAVLTTLRQKVQYRTIFLLVLLKAFFYFSVVWFQLYNSLEPVMGAKYLFCLWFLKKFSVREV